MKTADSEHYHFSYPKSILVTVNKQEECKCKPSMTDDQAGLNQLVEGEISPELSRGWEYTLGYTYPTLQVYRVKKRCS